MNILSGLECYPCVWSDATELFSGIDPMERCVELECLNQKSRYWLIRPISKCKHFRHYKEKEINHVN